MAISDIYSQILKVEVNRCNFFLINQLFKHLHEDIPNCDSYSKQLVSGVLALVADYFENKDQLQKYLSMLLKQTLQVEKEEEEGTLFQQELSPEAHIFKLKRNSNILAVKLYIGQQIILGNDKYHLKIKLNLGKFLRKHLLTPNNKIIIKFNHPNMQAEVDLQVSEGQQEWIERQVEFEPLYYIHRDAIFHIEEVRLVMKQKLVWLLQRSQLTFEKYDSTMFHSKISEPEIQIINVSKIYYLQETFCFGIKIHGIEDCKVSASLSVTEEEQGKTQFFLSKEAKIDLTNSNKYQQLKVGDTITNDCWIKCNKLGGKTLKLIFNILVEKHIEVNWKEKPLHIKSTYNSITRQIRFQVQHLFTITKLLREAITGRFVENHVPIGKKMMMTFKVKANDNINITEITHHNNPKKIKYNKNFKVSNMKMSSGDILELNLFFQLLPECAQQFDLFLTTLFIKWKRPNSNIDNISLDQYTVIHPNPPEIDLQLLQLAPIKRRQKGSIVVRIKNLQQEPNNIYVSMESTEHMLRIGDKGKWKVLQGQESCDLQFSVFCMNSGIFEVPPLKVLLNQSDFKISTSNFLVHCL